VGKVHAGLLPRHHHQAGAVEGIWAGPAPLVWLAELGPGVVDRKLRAGRLLVGRRLGHRGRRALGNGVVGVVLGGCGASVVAGSVVGGSVGAGWVVAVVPGPVEEPVPPPPEVTHWRRVRRELTLLGQAGLDRGLLGLRLRGLDLGDDDGQPTVDPGERCRLAGDGLRGGGLSSWMSATATEAWFSALCSRWDWSV
jgi:hypothetical protein